MTATDELRRLLDERGVEWGANDTYRLFVTSWSDASGHSWVFMEHRDGSFSKLTAYHLTPAQAIAATLGDVPRLPYFWTHDGTLHIELPKLPESISVRLPDQRDREVSSARTWQYTQGSGTCHADETDTIKCWVKCKDEPNTERMELIHVMECSACGGTYEHVNGSYEFCPRCGAHIVEVN